MRKGGQDRARENRGLSQHSLEILPGEAYSVPWEPRKRRMDRLRTPEGRARMGSGRDGRTQ